MFVPGHQKPLASAGGFTNPADNPLGYLNEYRWWYNHRDDDAAMLLQLILNAARAWTQQNLTISMIGSKIPLRLKGNSFLQVAFYGLPSGSPFLYPGLLEITQLGDTR
jgi:hypothetical protein